MVSINTVVDVVGALVDDSLRNNIYLVDNNKANGSTGLGTDALQSAVNVGDTILWTVESLEPEAYAMITGIEIDSLVDVTEGVFPGSDVIYWKGIVEQQFDTLPYKLEVTVGTRTTALVTETDIALVQIN